MLTFLGQVCFEFNIKDTRFLIDPYFSNSVEKEDSSLIRKVPIPYDPKELTDMDFVLITHAHGDHCDIETLRPLSVASPQCQFFGPPSVAGLLMRSGINANNVHTVTDKSFSIKNIKFTPIPSAHPDVVIDKFGGWMAIGYIFEIQGVRYYHPGDTAVAPQVIASVSACGKIDVGMIPVNECNYYRAANGIIGNMSVREAFQFSEDIGLKVLIPTHWDMFAGNQVYKEEIELLYKKDNPNFKLLILEAGQSDVG